MRCITGRGCPHHAPVFLPGVMGQPHHAAPCCRCLDYVLEEIKHSRKANVMVATHNEDTVKFTLRRWVLVGCPVPARHTGHKGSLLFS